MPFFDSFALLFRLRLLSCLPVVTVLFFRPKLCEAEFATELAALSDSALIPVTIPWLKLLLVLLLALVLIVLLELVQLLLRVLVMLSVLLRVSSISCLK